MATIGFIGSGNLGSALARLVAIAGHDVVLSNSRGPETLGERLTRVGPRASAGTVADAAARGDLVVVSTPLRAYRSVPVAPLRGKVVIDTINFDPARDGDYPEITAGRQTASGVLQEHLPESFVVKAFSNMFFKHLATMGRPAGAPDRSTLPIAGDDAEAKRTVATLADEAGFDTLDAGPLAESRRFARGTPAFHAYLDPDGMFTAPGRPASTTALAKLLAAAN
ncbi:putative dinucleotide-binding enzyme [Catenuloplanes nepalensis]|uniref:Dinucleotide-binding enzyme n=1 Tax=Catenuloplanes nepalensis TaxID=587533 RepID=A0ABT9MUE3_9ACTN|nr:NADPH-dependent F420 reductase [Catenuloplanes nepalensis]MDP9795015.1 putative dinucleotide-binding enzyme [Catenuloplanes nepalensis]